MQIAMDCLGLTQLSLILAGAQPNPIKSSRVRWMNTTLQESSLATKKMQQGKKDGKEKKNAVLVKSSVAKFLNSPGVKSNFKRNKQFPSWGRTDNTNTCSEPGPCVLMGYQKKPLKTAAHRSSAGKPSLMYLGIGWLTAFLH